MAASKFLVKCNTNDEWFVQTTPNDGRIITSKVKADATELAEDKADELCAKLGPQFEAVESK